MSEPKQISSAKIIIIGNLIVNLPVIIVILITALVFYYLDLGFSIGIIAGSFIGWITWARLLKVWKKWAFENGVSPERLYELGKIGFINFYRYRIIEPGKDNLERSNTD